MRVEPGQHALLTRPAEALNKDKSAFIPGVVCRPNDPDASGQTYSGPLMILDGRPVTKRV